jgi:hypothetical protein
VLSATDIALVAAVALGGAAPPAGERRRLLTGNEIKAGLFTTLERAGLPAALDSLERFASRDSAVLREGHQLAHALGREALTTSKGDPAILGQCRPAFASGCYHGVVEALLRLRGRVDMAELQRMCLAAGGSAAVGPVYECTHGLGHGVLGAVGLQVDTALRHCDALTEPRLAVSCHQGVFMEAITVALNRGAEQGSHHHGHEQRGADAAFTINPADPFSPCDRYSDPYADSCWLFQGFIVLKAVGFDAARALRICRSAPAGREDRCFQSLGHQLAGLFQRSDVWIAGQCDRGGSERALANCASGAALALAAMDWSGGRVHRFCASLPRGARERCSTTAAEALALVS